MFSTPSAKRTNPDIPSTSGQSVDSLLQTSSDAVADSPLEMAHGAATNVGPESTIEFRFVCLFLGQIFGELVLF